MVASTAFTVGRCHRFDFAAASSCFTKPGSRAIAFIRRTSPVPGIVRSRTAFAIRHIAPRRALARCKSSSLIRHQASGHTAYATQAEDKRALFLAAAGPASDSDAVAREIIKAIHASCPKTRYAVGANAKPSVFMSTFMPDRFNDWLMGVITKTLLKQQQRKAASQAA